MSRSSLLIMLILATSLFFIGVSGAVTLTVDVTNNYATAVAVIYRDTNNVTSVALIQPFTTITLNTTSTQMLVAVPVDRNVNKYLAVPRTSDWLVVGETKSIPLLPTNSNGHFQLILSPNGDFQIAFYSKTLEEGFKYNFNASWTYGNFISANITLPPFPTIEEAGYNSIADGASFNNPTAKLLNTEIINPEAIPTAISKSYVIASYINEFTVGNTSLLIVLNKAIVNDTSSLKVLTVFVNGRAVQFTGAQIPVASTDESASVFVATSTITVNSNKYVVFAYFTNSTEFSYDSADKIIMINIDNTSDVKILSPTDAKVYNVQTLKFVPVINPRIDPLPTFAFVNYFTNGYQDAFQLRNFYIFASTETQIPNKAFYPEWLIGFTTNIYWSLFQNDNKLPQDTYILADNNISPALFISSESQKYIYVATSNETYLYSTSYAIIYDEALNKFITFAQLVDNYTNVTFVNVTFPTSASETLKVDYSNIEVADYLTFNPSSDFHNVTILPSISSGSFATVILPQISTSSNTPSSNTSINAGGMLVAIQQNNGTVCVYTPSGEQLYCTDENLDKNISLTSLLSIFANNSPLSLTSDSSSLLDIVNILNSLNNITVNSQTLDSFVNANVAITNSSVAQTQIFKYLYEPVAKLDYYSSLSHRPYQLLTFVSYKKDSIVTNVVISDQAITIKPEHLITWTEDGVTFAEFVLTPDDVSALALMTFKYLTDANAKKPTIALYFADGSVKTYDFGKFAKEHELPYNILSFTINNTTLPYSEAFPSFSISNFRMSAVRFFVIDYTSDFLMQVKLSADYIVEFAFIFSQDTLNDFYNFLHTTATLYFVKQPYIRSFNVNNPSILGQSIDNIYEKIPLDTYVFYSTNNVSTSNVILPATNSSAITKYSTFVVIFYKHIVAPAIKNPLSDSVFFLKLQYPTLLTDTIQYDDLISHLKVVKLYSSLSEAYIIRSDTINNELSIQTDYTSFALVFTTDYYKRILVQFTFNLQSKNSADFALLKNYNTMSNIKTSAKTIFDKLANNIVGNANKLILLLLLIVFIVLYVKLDYDIAVITTLALAVILRDQFTSITQFISVLVVLVILTAIIPLRHSDKLRNLLDILPVRGDEK